MTRLLAIVLACAACGPLEPEADIPGQLSSAITTRYEAGTWVKVRVSTRLRAGPGTGYPILTTLAQGTTAQLVLAGSHTDWFYKVKAGGMTGWAYAVNLHSATARYGVYPDAYDALKVAGLSSRFTQTIGNAPASNGVHKQDGTSNGQPYPTATDISVKGTSWATPATPIWMATAWPTLRTTVRSRRIPGRRTRT